MFYNLLIFEGCKREVLVKPLVNTEQSAVTSAVMDHLLPQRQESKPENGKEYTRIGSVLVLAGLFCL